MLYEFLNELRSELCDKRDKLNEQLETVRLNRRETEKFSELIASENEQPFSDFSPHVVNTRAQAKLEELAHEIDDMDTRFDRLEAEISGANETIGKIDLALEEYQALKNDRVEDDETEISSVLAESVSGENVSDLLAEPSVQQDIATEENVSPVTAEALERIRSYLPADPMRARLELDELIANCKK